MAESALCPSLGITGYSWQEAIFATEWPVAGHVDPAIMRIVAAQRLFPGLSYLEKQKTVLPKAIGKAR